MKARTLVVVFLFVGLFPKIEGKDLNELINNSLLLYLEWQSNIVNKPLKDNKTIYICLDNYPSNFSFSEKILKKDVKFMSLQNISYQKELKKKENYRFLFIAICLEQNHLIIKVFGKDVLIHNKNNVQVAVVDWGIFNYEFSCDRQEWELKEKKFGGV